MTVNSIVRSGLVLLVAVIAASPASAVCNPPKSVSTYNFATGAYSYWHTSLPPQSTTLVAQIWSGSTEHTGTCNESSGILYFGATPGDIGVNLSLGNACVAGCPVGSLSIQATALTSSTGETLIAKTAETPGGAVNFDFSETGNHALGDYRPPQITSASNMGGGFLALTFRIDPPLVLAGAESELTAFNVLQVHGQADPGRFPGAYTLLTTIPAPPPGGVATGSGVVFCSSPGNDYLYLVTQLVTGAGPSSTVSGVRSIFCGSRLADPGRKPKNSMTIHTEN